GDLDGNGKVDQADLELLRSSYAFNPGGKLTPEKPQPAPDKNDENASEKSRSIENADSKTKNGAN
ncbi:MAG: hypothetical protein GXN93_01055, partial [Candidatus Diapherotrites archaeon]|nr:hypothetical protein [Candidatus Diapherotrites archaeon]